MNDSSSSDHTMSIQRPLCFFNLWSSCSSRPKQPVVPHAPASCGRMYYRGGLTAPYYSHRWPGPAATAASHRSLTSEPSYSSRRGLPLLRLPRLRIVPFLGLAIVHCPGALGVTWSMWSTTDFHRKSIVRGEANSWVHDRSKEVPPYYSETNDSST